MYLEQNLTTTWKYLAHYLLVSKPGFEKWLLGEKMRSFSISPSIVELSMYLFITILEYFYKYEIMNLQSIGLPNQIISIVENALKELQWWGKKIKWKWFERVVMVM
jgi:hypothetical protein